MLGVKDYVYSFLDGIGIVKEIKDGKYHVYYQDKDEYVTPDEVQEIHQDVASIVKNRDYKDFFDYATFKRGVKYYMEDRVSDVHIIGKNITGTVYGTEDYSVTITVSKNSIRSRCSCPVGFSCKHSVAVLTYVSDILKDLESQIGFTIAVEAKKYNDIPDELKKILDSFDDSGRGPRLNLNACVELTKILKDKDFTFYEDLISFLNKNYRNKVYSMNPLKKIIALNESFYGEYEKMDISIKYSSFGQEIQRTRETLNRFLKTANSGYSLRNYGEDIIVLYYISNGYLEDLEYFILKNNNKKAYQDYLPDLFKLLPPKEDMIGQYEDYVKYYGDIPLVSSAIVENLSPKERIDFYKRNPNITIPFPYIKTLPFPEQAPLLLTKYLNHELGEYILNKYYTFKSFNPILAIQLLSRVHQMVRTLSMNVEALLKEEKNTDLVLSILKRSKKNIDYTNEAIYSYISTYYDITESNNSYSIEYYVELGGISFSLGHFDGLKYYYGDNEIRNKAIIDRIERDEKYQEKVKEVKERIYQKNYEAKRREYQTDILDFASSIIDNDLVVAERNKMALEVNLYSTWSYGEDGYAVSFRVGNEKLYVVKDIIEFLDAVRDGETIQYGKGLSFNHQIDNFNDSAREALSFFLSLPYGTYMKESRKGLMLSNITLEAMFEALKGHWINLYDNPTLLRLNEFSPIVEINRDYLLKTNLDDYELFDFNSLYVYDKRSKTIDKIKGNKKELQFYRFVNEHIGMDISMVKEEFIDTIYSRFYKYINIAEEIANEFLGSELRICAYFDLEDNAITVSLSYYKKEMEILKGEIKGDADLSRIRIFEAYLDALGFINGKLTDEAKIYEFLLMDFTRLRELAEIYLSESIKNKTISKMEKQNVRIQYNNSMMEMFLEESDYSEEELYQILLALKKKKKYILLKDDRILDLDNEEAKEFYDTVTDLDMDPKHLLKSQYSPIYQSFKAYSHEGFTTIDSYVSNMMDEIVHFKDNKKEIPEVNAELRNYQKEGYLWLSVLSRYHLGGILADDMGLGKTLEMITLLKGDRERMPSLIVCPKSLIFNWISEFEKFDPETKTIKIYGSSNQRHEIIQGIPRDEKIIYITGYDSLRNDLEYYEGKMFNYILLDEAQAIKNVHAIKSQSVKKLEGINKFALTGTPIENSVLDLWSIFDFLMPGYFPPLNDFKNKYENNDAYTDAIRKKVAPFILRRTKDEVLKDLPSKYERIFTAEMEKEQKKIYDAYIYDAKQKMELGVGAFEMLPYLMRLRQICVDPSLFIENYHKESGKIGVLKEILKEYIPLGHRILLFSSFVSALNLVEEYLIKENIGYLKLTGDTKPEDRQRFVNLFNKDIEYKIFLISLKAGGTGLNLTGADTVIHLDPWWNVSAENQATDRAHRIGQVRNVEVIKIICEESIEQRVIELQNIKKDVIDRIIAKDDSSITGISLEDLKFILE